LPPLLRSNEARRLICGIRTLQIPTLRISNPRGPGNLAGCPPHFCAIVVNVVIMKAQHSNLVGLFLVHLNRSNPQDLVCDFAPERSHSSGGERPTRHSGTSSTLSSSPASMIEPVTDELTKSRKRTQSDAAVWRRGGSPNAGVVTLSLASPLTRRRCGEFYLPGSAQRDRTMFPVPRRVFLTHGVGTHRQQLSAFEYALRAASSSHAKPGLWH